MMDKDDIVVDEKDPYRLFRRGDDIMSANATVHWVVKHFIERNTLNMVYGDPKSGKSFIVYDMALHVAHGRPWRGRKVTQGAVFVLCGEGQGGISRRLKAWDHYHQYEPTAPFFVSDGAKLLGRPNEAESVATEVDRMAAEYNVDPIMVIIDTLARNFDGDENSSEDASRFITEVDKYLKSKRKCAVIVVHHSGNADKGRGRGSSAFVGALDACFNVVSQKTDTGLDMKFTTDYLKDGASPETLHFDCVEVEVDRDDDKEPVTSLCPIPKNPPPPPEKEDGKHTIVLRGILEAMENDDPVTFSDDNMKAARKTFYESACNFNESQETKKKRFSRAWSALRAERLGFKSE